MRLLSESRRSDDPYVAFRMRTFDAGTLLSYSGCFAYAIYYGMTWTGGEHRRELVALTMGTVVATVALRFAPIEAIVRSDRWREPFFISWSASLIFVVSAGAALDGGAHAALALAYFLPLAFAALSYPTRVMIAVTAMDVGAFLVMSIAVGGAGTGFIFMFACALVTAGWMSALQSRIHELHLRDRLRDEERIAHLAFHDLLTGLPNRAELLRQIDGAVAREQRHVLLHIDLDGFKLVNDSLGHAAGDDILRQLARRLEPVAAGRGILARRGGDQFALLTTAIGDDPLADAERLAHTLLAAIREPLEVDGTEFQLEAGIGIALYPDHASSAQDLLRRADAAMYQAKASGHGGITFYAHESEDARTRLMMTGRLRRALANGELTVHYQPIFEPRSGRIAMVEALARWEDPERGLIPPLEFIPFAEETGLIVEIGDRIVDLITAQALRWRAAGLTPAISFNISPRQLREPDFAKRLSDRIATAGGHANQFTAEITESAMVDDPARIEPVLHELAATGIRLAIDDFGADHSSLGRLRGLPVHMLKVDRGLLRGAPADSRGAAIVTSLLLLADALRLISVVEGVETEEQRVFLDTQNCPLAQGFHLGRPAPAEATTRLLEQDAVAAGIAAERSDARTS